MTLDEAQKQQTILQQQGQELLNTFDLVSLYAQLGKVQIVGSFKYGLMVLPDVDINVTVENPQSKLPNIAELSKRLTSVDGIIKVSVYKNGFYTDPEPGKPIGIWLGLTIFFASQKWNIDTWFVPPDENMSLETTLVNLPQAQKDTILLLKAQLRELGRYGRKKDFYSHQIYTAVLDQNAQTIEDLENIYKNS